jgi:hypothetical protein
LLAYLAHIDKDIALELYYAHENDWKDKVNHKTTASGDVDDNFGNLMDHKTNILGDTNDVEQNQD